MIPFPWFIFYLKHSKVCRELQDKSARVYFFREKLTQRTVETDGSSRYCSATRFRFDRIPKRAARSPSVGAIPRRGGCPALGICCHPTEPLPPYPESRQVIKKFSFSGLQPGNENHQKSIKKIIKKPLPKFPGWFRQNTINR